MSDEEAKALMQLLSKPFYWTWDFWVNVAIGVGGLTFSVLAFFEARAAKNAAAEAGRTVKIQTITIELGEIAQRLDKLDFDLSFSEARDLLNEVSRRLRRLIAPFQSTDDLIDAASNLKKALDDAKTALEHLRPQQLTQQEHDEGVSAALNNVYFGMQGHFSNVSSLVAEIMGLFEKRTIEVKSK